ncbi:MAG: peptidylprolyl isomerase [Prevotellaceae bacterium]|jgi:peptidyl-prolyl cis-trans isomerase SurA|nr:peptidylprolyl isomerase [Prevotellaceae bacterium]
MKKQINLLLLLLVAFPVVMQAQSNVIDEIVWVVGDEAIFKSEVETQLQQMKYEKAEVDGNPYCIIPEQLAIRKLFLHQAKLDSLTANESNVNMQVNMRIDEMIAQIGSQEKLEEYFGRNIKKIREELSTQAREQALIQQVQQSLTSNLKITPSDVRKTFSQLKEDEIPTVPATTEVQILTIEPRYDPAEIEAIKTRLREFKQRVESGDASFSMLATLYSDDLGSARNGGELGFMGRAQLVPEFATEAFNLTDPNKVSKVIQSEFGFHIIQLIEKRGDKVNVRHILLKPKVKLEDKVTATRQLDSITDLIRSNKISFENAVMLFSNDKDTRMNGGSMANPKDGTTKFEYKDLPPEISKLAYQLGVGELSNPFTMTNPATGREVCAIIKVKAKTEAHKANMEEDYQLLKNFVQSKESAQIIDKWIREKQKDTYIRIEPSWQKCEFQYPGWVKK